MVVNKSIPIYFLLFILFFSSSSHAFTPNVTAMAFNSAMRKLDLYQLRRLIVNSEFLLNTLNSEEKTVLVNTGKLKISSYIYLLQFWQKFSMEKILAFRGDLLSKNDIDRHEIDMKMFSTPLGDFNSVENVISNNKDCKEPINKSGKYDLFDLYQLIEKLQKIIVKRKGSNASMAALVYIKSYYFLKFHVPVSTHTFVNNKCMSDLHGSLSCAAPLIKHLYSNDVRTGLIEIYNDRELKAKSIKKASDNTENACPINISLFYKSAGLIEPVNQDQVIQASELLFLDVDSKAIHKSNKFTIGDIMHENEKLLRYLYLPATVFKNAKKIPTGSAYSLKLQDAMLYRAKIAGLRLVTMLEADSLLGGKPRNSN